MYINADAKSVMLQVYLRQYFRNIIFKIKHKLHTASGSAPPPPPPPVKNSGWLPDYYYTISYVEETLLPKILLHVMCYHGLYLVKLLCSDVYEMS